MFENNNLLRSDMLRQMGNESIKVSSH